MAKKWLAFFQSSSIFNSSERNSEIKLNIQANTWRRECLQKVCVDTQGDIGVVQRCQSANLGVVQRVKKGLLIHPGSHESSQGGLDDESRSIGVTRDPSGRGWSAEKSIPLNLPTTANELNSRNSKKAYLVPKSGRVDLWVLSEDWFRIKLLNFKMQATTKMDGPINR